MSHERAPKPPGGLFRMITTPSETPDDEGFLGRFELTDGTEIGLLPRLYGAVLLTRGRPSGWTTYDDEWTYDHHLKALAAVAGFLHDGGAYEPAGWVRHRARGCPVVRRATCDACGRALEYGDDEDGVAEPRPICPCRSPRP
jgi:hypothetical protein